jgi:hypothetical protein
MPRLVVNVQHKHAVSTPLQCLNIPSFPMGRRSQWAAPVLDLKLTRTPPPRARPLTDAGDPRQRASRACLPGPFPLHARPLSRGQRLEWRPRGRAGRGACRPTRDWGHGRGTSSRPRGGGEPAVIDWEAWVIDWEAWVIDWEAWVIGWEAWVIDWEAWIIGREA